MDSTAARIRDLVPHDRMPAGRFAPTPSGRMHLGNLFSALLAWLSARSQGMRFVLRIEDLDVVASKAEYIPLIEDDLRWLGLDWDEGGLEGGPDAPYLQHERFCLYDLAFAELDAMGLVYPCFCSRAELHAASAPHASDGRVIYAGTCKGLSAEEVERRSTVKRPAWRLSVPDEELGFCDARKGPFSQNLAAECGDFIIRRSDGLSAYQLAVVVDDALMGVAEVVRGDDLLDSTPRQMYLQRLLGLPEARYAHTPMLMAPDGRRLSKRERDCDCSELRRRFTGPELVGKLAFAAGLTDSPEPVTPADLVAGFAWGKVVKHDIIVDEGFLA